MYRLWSAPLTVGLILALSACASTRFAAEEESSNPTATQVNPSSPATIDSNRAEPLLGLWRMTRLEVGTEDNLQPIPYTGQIAFTPDTVSVQAMNPDMTAADTVFTVQGYEAFYGPLTLDAKAGTFAVTVESAAARSLIGQTLTRNYDITGDTLVLTPIDPTDGFRVTYQRQTT
ncbi:lipocalin-like domain-containing protein [Nakamurella endophytica]|uniref:Lipocalin-like domain-containing protein n=1 Tax=Nakamurella endophytica TaxID=1748367 RepID=A0A917WPT3_9ACTN|nr:lipocalin-like domain-containing protein [Nakamurella endophytica]GGM19297.1 hypothetical protein GCM10011594_44170 [Nakamurella endophytica]